MPISEFCILKIVFDFYKPLYIQVFNFTVFCHAFVYLFLQRNNFRGHLNLFIK